MQLHQGGRRPQSAGSTGCADIGMAQIVPDHLQISFAAQMTASGVSHPVRRSQFQMCGSRLDLWVLTPQVSCAFPKNFFDDFVDGTAGQHMASSARSRSRFAHYLL